MKERGISSDRARAEAEATTIWFADEAGIRSDYHADTTWSPVGQTPVAENTGARHSASMISPPPSASKHWPPSATRSPTPRPYPGIRLVLRYEAEPHPGPARSFSLRRESRDCWAAGKTVHGGYILLKV